MISSVDSSTRMDRNGSPHQPPAQFVGPTLGKSEGAGSPDPLLRSERSRGVSTSVTPLQQRPTATMETAGKANAAENRGGLAFRALFASSRYRHRSRLQHGGCCPPEPSGETGRRTSSPPLAGSGSTHPCRWWSGERTSPRTTQVPNVPLPVTGRAGPRRPSGPAGANLKELIGRMGHDSERAALIYVHSSRARQRVLTDAMGEAARAELARSRPREASELEGTREHATAAHGLILPIVRVSCLLKTCAPTATRTRDLPLRRRPVAAGTTGAINRASPALPA